MAILAKISTPPKKYGSWHLDGKLLRRPCAIINSNSQLMLGREFALRARAMVREVIRDQLDVGLSDVSVGLPPRKPGQSPQRPLRWA